MLSRLPLPVLLGGIVTIGLIMVMVTLTQQEVEEPPKVEPPVIQDFITDIKEPEPPIEDPVDERPEELEPPPELPENKLSDPKTTVAVGKTPTYSAGPVKIETSPFDSGVSELVPISQPPARYPPSALRDKQEGSCVLEFAVNETGRTEDVRVVNCTDKVFAKASVSAVQKYKYQPRVVDGDRQGVERVRQTLRFELPPKK